MLNFDIDFDLSGKDRTTVETMPSGATKTTTRRGIFGYPKTERYSYENTALHAPKSDIIVPSKEEMMKAIQSLNLSENVYVSKKNGIPSNFPTDENDIIIPSPGDPIKLLFALSRELGKNENMRKTCIGVEKNISTKITESQTIRIPIRKS